MLRAFSNLRIASMNRISPAAKSCGIGHIPSSISNQIGLIAPFRGPIIDLVRPAIMLDHSKRWATKKMGSSKARQKRRPDGKRLGLKKYPGEFVEPGNIIVKQRGLKNHPGKNVAMGADSCLYALMPGYVHITHDPIRNRKFINVVEADPSKVDLPTEHTAEFHSKIIGGWRNDEMFTRGENGQRICTLVNLKDLPAVEKWDLSAVEFDPMTAHLKATGLDKVLSEWAAKSQ